MFVKRRQNDNCTTLSSRDKNNVNCGFRSDDISSIAGKSSAGGEWEGGKDNVFELRKDITFCGDVEGRVANGFRAAPIPKRYWRARGRDGDVRSTSARRLLPAHGPPEDHAWSVADPFVFSRSGNAVYTIHTYAYYNNIIIRVRASVYAMRMTKGGRGIWI